MAILALDWYIWVALGLLFLYALARRLLRSRRGRRRRQAGSPTSWALRAGRAYGSKRP